MIISYAVEARAQTAGDVLDKMSAEQSASYINGVVEGLAYARWLKDRPDQTGMRCIYDWNYGEDSEVNTQRLLTWFEQQPDKPVGALVHVMIKKDCGE
ncbi:hypothetical protein LA5095_01947 [Roseibium album]|uniref:Uncharacterized protein n=2 Tax=Roseibium album TaxID=311410 RepID=A0A0M6ZTW5_9HYPH|nr:hypothetical protein LA5094_00892 [Roseibium album]CTQ65651.1 hypothetical protein LA5096_00803 [Roseibium album]CTQ70528.1 hypothetical protein LA5095_01947 [Roseibium album]